MALLSSMPDRLPVGLLAACANCDTAAAALEWGGFGVPVLALWPVDERGGCGCGDLRCDNRGKHPLSDLAPRGYRSATTERARLLYVFRARPDANLGLRMGGGSRAALRLVALDIDPRNGGDEGLDRVQATVGPLPVTTTVRTGGGGEHRLFVLPQGGAPLPSRGLAPGVELKADKAVLVAAPSRHASRRRYEIIDDRPPVVLPDTLAKMALRTPTTDWAMRRVLGSMHRGGGGRVGTRRCPGSALGALTPGAIARAEDIVGLMLTGPDAAEAAVLFGGDPLANCMPDKSLSGADHRLGRLAKRHSRDPLVIEAVLRLSGLARPKYDRPDYLVRTVDAVLRDDPGWLDRRRAIPAHAVGRRGVQVRPRVKGAIIRYVAGVPGDERDGDGLARLPVGALAATECVSEETVRLAIHDLVALGVVVTRVERRRLSGGWECERWIALTVPPEAALVAAESVRPVGRTDRSESPTSGTRGSA